jgi:hypothetical protein
MYFKARREMTPWIFTFFRLFNLPLGRWQRLNGVVRKLIIHLFLTGKKRTGVIIERQLHCTGDAIEVRDILVSGKEHGLPQIFHLGFFSTVYMASARYFRRGNLRQAWSREVPLPLSGGDRLASARIPILTE